MTKRCEVAFRFPQQPNGDRRDLWPFYLTRRQRQWLASVREQWGENCVVQIANGEARIIAENGELAFCSAYVVESKAISRKPGLASLHRTEWAP
ncbi:hypothetical protein [Paraburkholderia nodosa]|uniref:hypothetical protein n=1 Tax=Paraburkholderia nodosa TaxID=392320 RepID=UPI0012B6AA22|nr:hypothetical protein [Paraburkholderia nodosa]